MQFQYIVKRSIYIKKNNHFEVHPFFYTGMREKFEYVSIKRLKLLRNLDVFKAENTASYTEKSHYILDRFYKDT